MTKIEYDVEACEADMDVYQAERLDTYEQILDEDMTHEMNAYEIGKVAIVEAAEKQIQEIVAMRDETLVKEEVRHTQQVEEMKAVYDMNVEEAIYEHEEVVKGLRDAYLKDMDLDTYIDTLDDKAYLAAIDAEDYKIEAKVEVDPVEQYDECDECYDCQDPYMNPYMMDPYMDPYMHDPYRPHVDPYMTQNWAYQQPAYGQPAYGQPAYGWGYQQPAYGWY